MLGLRRHTVRLVPHDPAWASEFDRVATRIASAAGLPRTQIDHVGSTAVDGLPAKPIIDIDVAASFSDNLERVVQQLLEVGFIDRGQGAPGIGRLLVLESEPEVRVVHVHIHPIDSAWRRNDLLFRDALRADAQLRERYAQLKADLASRFAANRRGYREAKAAFFREEPIPTSSVSIGVISDTHGLLRDEALHVLRSSDLIIHAGDVGSESILRTLGRHAPLRAVRGNVDKDGVCAALPRTDVVESAGVSIYVLHDLDELDLEPAASGFRIVVAGHSHRPSATERGGVLFFNPGSAGPRRFDLPVTVGLIQVDHGEVEAELVDLDAGG